MNIYWLYTYTKGWTQVTKKNDAIAYFILFYFLGIVMPYLVQKSLNQIARNYARQQMIRQNIRPQQYPMYPNYPGRGGQFRM